MALCYRDRSFCGSNCTKRDCDRFYSEAVRASADAHGLPIAFMDFSPRCDDYQPSADKPSADKAPRK